MTVGDTVDSGRRRVWVLAAVLMVVALLGFGIGTLIKSPAQQARESAPPSVSFLTVPAEMRTVSDSLVFRGTVDAAGLVSVVPKDLPSGVTRGVITAVPLNAGDRVQAGAVVLGVSGRPIIALQGALPAYRDLREGSQGPDVSQLQAALSKLNLSVEPDRAGMFGAGTSKALNGLYAKVGYTYEGSLPAREVLFLPSFPVEVLSRSGSPGSLTSAASMMLAAGQLRISSAIDPNSAALLRAEMPAQVTSEVLGQSVEAKVVSIGTKPNAESGQVTIVLEPSKPLAQSWYQQDVRINITTASSEGTVLAVPVTSLALAGDGSAKVIVRDSNGSQRSVAVTVGVTGGGYSEVKPLKDGDLSVGDLVVVGNAK